MVNKIIKYYLIISVVSGFILILLSCGIAIADPLLGVAIEMPYFLKILLCVSAINALFILMCGLFLIIFAW